MKKKLAKLLICVSMIGLVFSLGACGSDDDSNTGKPATQATTKKQSSSKQYASIKDYVESPEFQAQVKSMLEGSEESGISMTITGEGNKLIYTCTFAEQMIDDDLSLEDARTSLENTLEAAASQYTTICKQLPIYIDVKDPVVVVRYIDADGTTIYEREFTAED